MLTTRLDDLNTRPRLCASSPPVFAIEATCSGNVDGSPQGLSDQAPCLTVIGGVPMLGLVFDLTQRGFPTRSHFR